MGVPNALVRGFLVPENEFFPLLHHFAPVVLPVRFGYLHGSLEQFSFALDISRHPRYLVLLLRYVVSVHSIERRGCRNNAESDVRLTRKGTADMRRSAVNRIPLDVGDDDSDTHGARCAGPIDVIQVLLRLYKVLRPAPKPPVGKCSCRGKANREIRNRSRQ